MGGRTRLWTVVRTAEPNNVDALVGLGLAGWCSGDIDAVRAYFSTVLELAPEHPTAIEYLERIAEADAAAVDVAVADAAVVAPDDRADEAWSGGDTVLAMRLYTARLAADPEARRHHGPALYGLSISSDRDGPGRVDAASRGFVDIGPRAGRRAKRAIYRAFDTRSRPPIGCSPTTQLCGRGISEAGENPARPRHCVGLGAFCAGQAPS